jgi:AcrR family transcriptional regulator
MTPRPHDRILDAAIGLFHREGIHAVGISRIVAEADVAPMTLYRHFGGKAELVASALERWSSQWLQWLAEQVDRGGEDPSARFAGLWDALETWWASADFLGGSFVANAAAELRCDPDHPAHKVAAVHRTALRQFLEDLARAAGADCPGHVAGQLELLVHGATAVAALDRQPATPGVRALADAALAGGAR